MKILAIRGKNLASLEHEFDIDFTREPLKSSGIFAITGNTGAGKSTILDALCLALFDNAPRLKEAEQVEIPDIEDKTITQKDSRNILRRGAGEGYAEVDFIALNGDKYRSRWTVKRARGRTDGALQQTGIVLDNLSASTKEQGTKTELLKKITEIIGLTFGQFTRAVLLAQNDFSTFLKSKQAEKAELLEKLTGTEVYSKISTAIYQKTNDAKNELNLMQQRLADVELLPEEKMEAFLQEKEKLVSEIKPLKALQSSIEKKQEWIRQKDILKEEIADAERMLHTVLEKIREAGNRYEFLNQMDAAQEIRDIYFSWKEKQQQSDRLTEQITAGRKELEKISKQLEIVEKELQAARNNQEENEQKYASVKPEIERAKALDITIQSAVKNVKESREEFEIQEKNKNETEKTITVLQEAITGHLKKNEERKGWFTGKEAYQPIVTRIDFLVTLLNDIQYSKKQISQHSAILESGKKLLLSYQDKLKQQEAEADRLNRLLPAEIVQLRAGLKEGAPCPVCGSTHHPLKESRPATEIHEKELNRFREETAHAIASTKEHIERTQKEITQQETLTGNYRKQLEETTDKAADAFREIPGWEKEFEKGRFQERLTKFAGQWKDNEEQLQAGIKTVDIQQAKLENESSHLKQILDNYQRKKETWQNHVHTLEQLSEDRKRLLGGEKAEDVEIRLQRLREESVQMVESKKEAKEKSDRQKAQINGVLSQLTKDSEIFREEAEILLRTVNEWTQNPKHPVSFELLTHLMSKTPDWIAEEKKYLNSLNEKKVACSTSLKERQERMKSHWESANKPDEGQHEEALDTLWNETTGKVELAGKRLTEIEVHLSKHLDGLKRIKAFEEELKKKEQLYLNWSRLNDLLGSANGDKFKKIAQGYTLDVLLGYANKHLEELTERYRLEKIPETLSLQVIDNDMLGEVRTIHSLSGGESFLISLSLALGLSSLSSNKMKIESLFIDEGFGSLDIDTLSVAMNALENLQTQGRKIGVISHVEEMKERISTQIQVIKSANGKSFVEIKG